MTAREKTRTTESVVRAALMEGKPLARCSEFNGARLPDPDPKLSVEDVRALYAHQYPGIATAAITGPEPIGDKLRYQFSRAIRSKG